MSAPTIPLRLDRLPEGVTQDLLARRLASNTDVRRDHGCWTWTGYANANGYGVLSVAGRRFYAHRVALLLERGHLDADEFACHHCDNPPCVRPDHLYAGTPADNVRDMVTRGRHRPGTVSGLDHHLAQVPPERIAEAVARYLAGGVRQEDICAELGVSRATFCSWLYGNGRRDSGVVGQRVGKGRRPGVPARPCGTHAAYRRHLRAGEKPCAECMAAESAYKAAVYQRSRRRHALARTG